VIRLWAGVTSPTGTTLPGTGTLVDVTTGIGQWALIASLIGLLIGAAMWALGHYSQNYHQAYNGRKGVLVSGAAALLITAAPRLIDGFAQLGTGLH
jgi:hypothetical protein